MADLAGARCEHVQVSVALWRASLNSEANLEARSTLAGCDVSYAAHFLVPGESYNTSH